MVLDENFKEFIRLLNENSVKYLVIGGFAVAYHCAAKTGIEHNGKRVFVVDDTPTKTISKFYGVKPNTVRGWVSVTKLSYA